MSNEDRITLTVDERVILTVSLSKTSWLAVQALLFFCFVSSAIEVGRTLHDALCIH